MKALTAMILALLLALSACGAPPAEALPTPVAAASPSTTPSPTPAPTAAPAPGDMVRVIDIIPDIYIDLRYASPENFTGRAIYESGEAYLRYSTAKKLASVQETLKTMGYSLCIWDAYRPVAAQRRLWEVCPDPRYVSDPANGLSNHCRGNTVDITLVTLDGGHVEMPSGFDDFSPLADRDYSDVSAAAAERSRLLERVMSDAGFTGYSAEWWHYTDNDSYDILETLEG